MPPVLGFKYCTVKLRNCAISIATRRRLHVPWDASKLLHFAKSIGINEQPCALDIQYRKLFFLMWRSDIICNRAGMAYISSAWSLKEKFSATPFPPKQLVYCLLVQKYILMGSDKQSGSPRPLLGTLKMGRVRTILTHTYPYPHEHSRHIMTAVIIACPFFISSDNMHTLIHKLDSNIKWWSMYVCLIGFLYFFSSPFLGRTIQPSYSNFNRWYVLGFRLLHNPVLNSSALSPLTTEALC